jgi:hypothetical protein
MPQAGHRQRVAVGGYSIPQLKHSIIGLYAHTAQLELDGF